MKDEEVKVEEIEDSHTLGGAGRCYDVVIHTEICQGDGEGVLSEAVSLCHTHLESPVSRT